jgi:hypothetical protein
VGSCNRYGCDVLLGFFLARLYKLLPGYHRTNLGCPLAAYVITIVYIIPSVGVYQRTGEQVSGTTRLYDPVRERTN